MENNKRNSNSYKNSPLLSIIIAVLNADSTFQECLDSILEQTYSNRELIIIDGGSSDNTIAILNKYDKKIAYWESRKDRGIAHAWNKGMRYAKGSWMLFFGADDRLHDKQVLAEVARYLEKDMNHDIIYGQVVLEGGKFPGVLLGQPFSRSKLKKRMIIPNSAAFHRRSFLKQIGQFDEFFKVAVDYEIVLRKKDLAVYYINKRVAIMGGNGVSSRLTKRSLLESRKAQIKNNVAHRIIIELWYLYYRMKNILQK